jgi:hypothetical protein
MAAPRYLLGGGEKLSIEVPRSRRNPGEKAHPYTFAEAKRNLVRQWMSVATGLQNLPELACPGGQTVVAMTLHPSYLAKSYYPKELIQELGLRHLGSRAVYLTQPSSNNKTERGQPAPMLYLAGSTDDLVDFSEGVADWRPADEDVRDNFRRIEEIALPSDDRLKSLGDRDRGEIPLEIVLHADEEGDQFIEEAFAEFAASLDLEVPVGRAREAGGLVFLPMRAPRAKVRSLLDFSFLRAVRRMPRVKPLDPLIRSAIPGFRVQLPNEDAAAPELTAAIIDGGLPPRHGLGRWVTQHDALGVGAAVPILTRHGMAVTSAFLFGPLDPAAPPSAPYANIDHWRVMGADTAADDFELFSILDRIDDILSTRQYDFVNISLGPDLAIDDDDVNAWTSTLDTLLAKGTTVATVACGNNGERDSTAGLNRVQPPSDGVNVIAVGAASSHGSDWERAAYSAIGPGRSPGYVKPDLLAFGGSHSSPFLVLATATSGGHDMGTSFAAPLAMRCGVGVRAQFSDPLWAPTIKALLIHHADTGPHDRADVGWGRLSHNIADLVLCDDGEAHVIYQRQMPTTGAVRLYLPVPSDLSGDVQIKATFSFYCDVDPEDSLNYTRAGLDIVFRPNTVDLPAPYRLNGKLITPTQPATDSFFRAKDFYAPERELRDDAQKWETTCSRAKTKRASSLKRPAFDVAYQARAHGHGGVRKADMKIALIVTLRNKHAPDLYDRVLVSSGNRLQPLRQRVGNRVPVRV